MKKTEPLSASEAKRWTACKQQLTDGLQACFDTGLALIEIRDNKLYREEFDSFEQFCQQQYQIGKSYAYRLIQSAEIKMSPIGDKIQNEAQARAIAQVPETDRLKVLKIAKKSGDATAAAIAEAAEKVVKNANETAKQVSPIGDKSPTPEVRKDAIGRIIPDGILAEWDRAAKTATHLRSLASQIKCAVEKGLADKDVIFAEILNPTISEAAAIHYQLSQIAPHSVCPKCQAKLKDNCDLCLRRGWISKYRYDSVVTKEQKTFLEKVIARQSV